MQKEQIQEFTRRISQSNRSGLTVVTYDILFVHLTDAKEAIGKKCVEDYKQSLRMANKCLQELIETLDFSYELATELYRIYVYCKELLATAMYKASIAEIEESEALLQKLYKSFVEVAKTDDSAPLMQNAQTVYAGYTYGRNDVSENEVNGANNRGYFV